ncbi:MAG: hypothetical protein HOF10_03270 [Chloroflexi bacterium]|nr:hypothetical protein [Chloroflexota bacterium]
MELETPTNGQSAAQIKAQKRLSIGAILAGIIAIAGLIFIIYFLLQDGARTNKIKDIMIIFIGFELVLIATSITILIVQVSKLVNLFQNEIKPLVDSANETIYTLRGTASFISDSFVQPVMKFNSYIAAFKKMMEMLNFKK